MQVLRGDGVTSPLGKTPDRPVRLRPGRKKPKKLEAVRGQQNSHETVQPERSG
jgi:hypothetical protein